MYFTPWPVVVFTAFLSCTVADRVDLVGEIQQFERGSPCNNDRSDCVLLSVLVKRIVAPENEGAIYLSHVTPGDVIPVSASVEELGDIASSSNNPAKLHRSVYFELEKKETSAAWWQVVEKRPPLILPDSRHQSLSEQSPLRSRRQTGTADRIVHEAQCCYHGLGHFLVEKGTKDWCLKLTYPPQYSYLTCNSDADLCCQCCQLGYNIRASYSSNFCGLGPRLGYKGSCLVLFRLCCYDRPERHFELQNLDPANGLINGTFTVYGNPKRTEWELETDPGIPKTDELSLMISIIESWAEAVEIRFEPNGDRMSSGLFNATLDVTFPDGQKLHIDYTRVPGEGETQGYSVVTNVTGSIAESFDKLSHLTSFFLTPDFTDNSLTLVKGIASADTLPEGWSMSLGAAFKPARFAPSKSSQLDINLAIVRRKGHVVDVTTTSTIRTIGYEDIPLDILHTLKPQVTLWNTSVVHNSDNQSLGLIVDSEEDTVEVSLPSSEEDGSIAASIPPILGVLLLDQEGDRELFEGAVPSTAQGVVFGGEEEERTGSLVNSTLSGLSPSLSLSSVVTSSGEVPLRLDQVSKVSSLPVDTDGDGAPDAVAVVVFGGGPGEEPLGVYVVRTAAADPTGIPGEGSQASVSVSSKQVKGQPVLTLGLEETKPLDEQTRFETCCGYSRFLLVMGQECTRLPSSCPDTALTCCPGVLTVSLKAKSITPGEEPKTSNQTAVLNVEEDTVAVSLPSSEEDGSIAASIPPILGVLLLDHEGDRELFEGAVPSTALGVVFGGEEEEGTGSLVNSTFSGLPPSLSLSSVVTSSGEVPLRLDQVSKVSSLPVDTDGDGAPDAVAVVVFGGGPGEEPLGVYVVRTAAADPTGIPEEGSQASVSVSSKQVKGQPVLTLDLEETKPLDFSTLTSTCKALQLYYIQSGTPCPSLPTQCSSASFEPICNQHTRVSGVVNIVRENRTIATQPFSAIVTGSSSLNISSSSSSSLAPVSTLSVFTSSLPLLFLFNISLSHLSGTNITGLVGVDSPHPIPVQSVFLSEEKEGSLNFTLSSTVYFPSNMVEVSTLQQPMKAGLVHSFDKKRLYIAIFEDHSSSLLPSSVPAVFEIQYSNITDSTRLSIPLSGIQVAFNASSDGQGGLFSHFTQPTSTYDPVRLCSAVVQYLTRTNGKCIDVPQICPLHTFSALCTLPVTVAVGNILVEVENIPEPLKNVLNVSFEEDGLVLYTWTAATRNSLLENLSPLITPVFSWLSGSKDCISNDCLNGLQASEGNIHARIEAAFVTGEVVDIYFHFWPLAINRSSIGYGFEINITGRLPTSLYVPNHLLQYLIRLQEFAPGLVSGSEMVRICDSQTVQLSVTVNYTPSVTYNRPVFDNVRLNASFAHLTWQKDISALTFSSRASLIYPLSVTLSGIVTENLIESEPFLFHGTVPWIGNATANIFLPPLMSIGADDAPVHIASIPAVMSIHNICILTDPYGLCNFTGGIVTENRNASVLFDGKVLLNDSHLAILVNYNISGAHIGILGAVPNLRIVKLPGRMQNELFIVVLSASNSTESALPKFVFQISVTSSANVSEEGELSYAHTETLLSKRIVRLTAPTAAVIHQDKVSITLACEAIHNYLKVLSLKPCQFSPVACEVLCGSGMPSVPLFPVRIYLRGVINGTHYIPRTEIELRSGKITHNRIRAIFKLNLGATLCLDGYIKLLPLITPHLVWLSDIGVINVSGLYLPDHNFNGSASISFGALGGEITLEHSLVRRVRRDGSEMINYFITAQGTLPFGYRGIEPQKKFTFRLSEREPGKASSDMPVSLFPGSTADLVLKFAYTTSKANNCSSYNNSVVSVRHSDVIIRGFLDRLSVFITGGLQGFEAGKGCPLECACPGAPGTNSSFSSECVQTADSSVGECRGCPKGFEGKNCESCALGYYGNPVSGIACRKCRCNGNVDRSDPNWCDRQTGVCKCTGLTSGHRCDSCVAGAVVDGRGICRQPDGVRLTEQSNIVYQTEEGRLNLLRAKLEFRFDSSQANGSLLLLAQDDTASGDVLYAALYNARVVLHARISQQHYSLVTSQNYKPLAWHSFEVAYGQTGLSMGIGNESVSIGEEENWPDFNLGTELVIGQPLSSEIPSLPDFVQSEGLHGCIQSVSLIVGRQGTEETAAASAQPIRTREVSSCFTHHES